MDKETKPPKTIYEKLLYVQQNLVVKKGRYNKFGEYYYRSLEDVMECLKPVLNEIGATVTFTDELLLIGERYYVKATVRFSDGMKDVIATAYAREELEKKKQDGSQLTGGASSYARKYAAGALFLIDDAADSDATNKHGKDEAGNGNGNGNGRKPATFQKPAAKPGHKIIDPNDPVLKEAMKTAVEQSFIDYQDLHKDEMPEGKIFCEKYFKAEVWAAFKKLTTTQQKKMTWCLESVNNLAESILAVNCLTDIKVDPMA